MTVLQDDLPGVDVPYSLGAILETHRNTLVGGGHEHWHLVVAIAVPGQGHRTRHGGVRYLCSQHRRRIGIAARLGPNSTQLANGGMSRLVEHGVAPHRAGHGQHVRLVGGEMYWLQLVVLTNDAIPHLVGADAGHVDDVNGNAEFAQ